VEAVSSALLRNVNEGAERVYRNQVLLDREVRSLQAQSQRFVKQSQRWLDAFKGFDAALKVRWRRPRPLDCA
jgi:hypothetical protein